MRRRSATSPWPERRRPCRRRRVALRGAPRCSLCRDGSWRVVRAHRLRSRRRTSATSPPSVRRRRRRAAASRPGDQRECATPLVRATGDGVDVDRGDRAAPERRGRRSVTSVCTRRRSGRRLRLADRRRVRSTIVAVRDPVGPGRSGRRRPWPRRRRLRHLRNRWHTRSSSSAPQRPQQRATCPPTASPSRRRPVGPGRQHVVRRHRAGHRWVRRRRRQARTGPRPQRRRSGSASDGLAWTDVPVDGLGRVSGPQRCSAAQAPDGSLTVVGYDNGVPVVWNVRRAPAG